MIPAWKIKRELKRIVMQIASIPWFAISPIAKRHYDRKKEQYISVTEGRLPYSTDVAILLIFQPSGLLDSTLHTLDHFKARGIAPLVVSNAPLSESDKSRLSDYAWRIIERPNFGYDFGGYRDGILYLLDAGHELTHLYVMNDSIWFPLEDDSDLIDEARQTDADLFGFTLNNRVRGDHRRHIQSYFFAFGGKLVGSADFEAHWRGLFLTNNKNLVVRRCEIPMTEEFRSRGYSVKFRHTYADGAEALKTFDNATLKRIIEYQIRVDTGSAPRLERHLKTDALDDAWRAGVMEDVERGIFEKYFLVMHPEVLIRQLHSPLLKKDRQEIYQLQRRELISCGLDENFADVVRDEIRRWDAK